MGLINFTPVSFELNLVNSFPFSWVLLDESFDDSILPSGSKLVGLIAFLFSTSFVEADLLSDAFLQLLQTKVRADKKVKAIWK